MNLVDFESPILNPMKYNYFLVTIKVCVVNYTMRAYKMLRIQLFFMVAICQRKWKYHTLAYCVYLNLNSFNSYGYKILLRQKCFCTLIV